MSEIPRIGTVLDVYTTRQIRYQGKLAYVNRESQSITLENVRSFGTEKRCHGTEAVLPQPQIYDRVEFNAKNIVDIKRAYRSIEDDPAVLNQPIASRVPMQNQYNRTYSRDYNNHSNTRNNYGRQYSRNGGFQRNFSPRDPMPNVVQEQLGKYKLTRVPKLDPELQREFDFEKANEDFKKMTSAEVSTDDAELSNTSDGIDAELLDTELTSMLESAYDKDSFFDKLSTTADAKWDRNSERARNLATFNCEASFSNRGFGRHNSYQRPRFNNYNRQTANPFRF